MSERPLVSIVVGVLNGEATLARCLDSVAAQTLASRELVVQDGGSTDGTRALLAARGAEIAAWRSERDRGLYDAWNRALELCRGEWICFLGCDDQFADADSLAQLVAHARADSDLVCSRNAMVDADGRFIKLTGHPWRWEHIRQRQVVAHPGMLHRAALFQRHGKFDTSYRIGGDYEWLLRLGPEARAVFVDRVTAKIGADGMSHVKWQTTLRERWRAQARHADIGPLAATRHVGTDLLRYWYKRAIGRR